jgi:hypothetical protein
MAEQAAIGFGDGLGQVKSPAHSLKFFSITHNYLLLLNLVGQLIGDGIIQHFLHQPSKQPTRQL